MLSMGQSLGSFPYYIQLLHGFDCNWCQMIHDVLMGCSTTEAVLLVEQFSKVPKSRDSET